MNVEFRAGNVGFTAEDHDLTSIQVQFEPIVQIPVNYYLRIAFNELYTLKDVVWQTTVQW